jgi:DNA-directed RNA polymerase
MTDLTDATSRLSLERAEAEAKRMEKAFGAAATAAGHRLVQQHIDRLTAFIARKRSRRPMRQNKAMKSLTPEVFALMQDVPHDEIAQASLYGVINALRAPPDEDEDEDELPSGRGRRAKEIIGGEVERACRAFYLRKFHKSLAADIEAAARYKSDIRKRLAKERLILLEHNSRPRTRRVNWLKWTKTERVWVGNWALDCCLQELPDLVVLRSEGKDKIPDLAEGVWDDAVAVMRQRAIDHPPDTTKLTQPDPWTWTENEDREPFLRNNRDEGAVRKAIETKTLRRHMDAVNYLQSMAWTLDPFMLNFVKELSVWLRIPLLEIESGRKDKGPRQLLRWDLEQAELLRGKTFWTPMACEWRGRVMPLPYFNYSRGDHIRSMFRFAKGAPIGERGLYWLRVSTANQFNEDRKISRLPFDERVEWTERNMDRIRAIAENPKVGLRWRESAEDYKPGVKAITGSWLEEAADPFQFIAHCRELVAATNDPEFNTTLPLPLDASNSGAQHYSLLARDLAGAELTNLVGTGEVRDLYEDIVRRINDHIAVMIDEGDEADRRRAMWWNAQDFINRKHIKALIVAAIYGQGDEKRREKIFEELRDIELNLIADGYKTDDCDEVRWRRLRKEDLPEGHLEWLEEAFSKALTLALPGFVPIRDFLRDTAKALAPKNVLRWPSPSGVPICNRYWQREEHSKQVYLGAHKIRHKIADGYLPILDIGGCVRGAAPNFIHSLEASHLAFVALGCKAAERIPLATVHDTFATLGPDVDEMRTIWLRELRVMYENENLLQSIYDDARKVTAALPSVPKRGEFELEQVNGAYALA